MTLSGATTRDQTEPGSDGNKGVFRNVQSWSLISYCLVSYYSTASADWATLVGSRSYSFAEILSVDSAMPAD